MCLFKCLYGLKESAKRWHKKFIEKIKDFCLTAVTADDCMFTLLHPHWDVLHIVIVIYNCLQLTNKEALHQEFLAHLQTSCTVSDNWQLDYFLGIGYKRRSWIAKQTGYIDHRECGDG